MKKGLGGCLLMLVMGGCLLFALLIPRCGSGGSVPTLTATGNRTDGTAVYVLIDVSGSMAEQVPNAEGKAEQKMAIARRAGIEVCKAVAKYAGEQKTRTLRLAVASFSDSSMTVLPMDAPDVERATVAINSLHSGGGTAIGDAVAEAQRALDQTHLKGQHILVLTDGENTVGTSPNNVAAAINALPAELRPSVYVIAFDVNAGVFAGVKSQGWQIFSAANGKELAERLDEVVGGHILIER